MKFMIGLLLVCFLFQGCAKRKNGYIIYHGTTDSACIQGHIYYDVGALIKIPKFDESGKPCECDTNAKK